MGSSNSGRLSRAIAALCVCGAGGLAQAETGCAMDKVLVSGDFGEAIFTVEVADDSSERARGLMHRESLAASAGMLFVFEAPRPAAFWMKNTLIPLDIIFADRTGTVRHIHENAIPHDETPIPGGDDIFAVLEINGGLSARFGLSDGDILQHPAFAGGPAARPCDK